jgi:hypothetical protein
MSEASDTPQPGGSPGPENRRLGARSRRSTVSLDRRTMTARWERSDDGPTWQPWMQMLFTRMA